MIIKKFQANTETEAILSAKNGLGKDAIVMNIKKISPRGLFKLFRKSMVEVTAAIDEYQPQPEMKVIEPKVSQRVYEEVAKDKNAIEERLNDLQKLLAKQLIQSEKTSSKEVNVKEALEEENHNITCLRLIYNQLIKNDVDEKYANQIIGEIEPTLKKDASVDNILASFYQKIILKLGQPKTLEYSENTTKYVFFIGPTGVGKTTTIAKIASSIKVGKKGKVALVTSDTYRIAAVEQLRTYANILNVPLHVIYSEAEMEQVKENFKGYEVVLVDTAGRSHKLKEQRDDIEKLIKSIPKEDRETYLVLSATTKYRDLVKIAEAYSDISEFKLIFTKLDETNSIGNIFNIRMLTNAPLSYATFGQNVPDDISKIDAQDIAKQLLGGNE